MKKINVKAPAKINLTLKVKGTRQDGFHEIESIMQTVSLYDFIELTKIKAGITLQGNHAVFNDIENNIAYKAAKLFFETTKINEGAAIEIEKNIPISAGLAGGSADGAGVLFGLNEIFEKPLTQESILKLCQKLGSDLDFCLTGGRALVKGRGEVIEKLPFEEFPLTIVKPKNLGISAKEAYSKFDLLKEKSTFANDLEFALINDYKELQYLHSLGLQMSGSGSAFFKIGDFSQSLKDDYQVIKNLKATPFGVERV